MSDWIKVKCPVCGRIHELSPEVQEFRCKGRLLVLLRDRLGWRLVEVRTISEREDAELDEVWSDLNR